ncbi:uncharacterized protein Bfra_001327ia [Botrytis fragariae]|uniref:Uncharacterized protein n=1 Tax=Botrytis fragariae TaxID=1964551 RepID=A0A8H6B090_9HELO|nr:uncharacterized protein Bfra_001327ia [Botrytis fragariae]KAF5876969.1 hypothetical protein Bfra_001327ia [Botrytis fragariae]
MFNIRVLKLEDRNGTLYVDEDYPDEEIKMQIFHDFPVNLVQNVEDKHALLAQNACSEAITWMQEVTGQFLTGIAAKIAEVGVTPKNAKRRLVQGHSYGGAYSLDLTSAQYGYYLPVTPWPQYLDNRVSKIYSSGEFGDAKNEYTTLINDPADPIAEIGHINQGCSDAMKAAQSSGKQKSACRYLAS